MKIVLHHKYNIEENHIDSLEHYFLHQNNDLYYKEIMNKLSKTRQKMDIRKMVDM